MNQPILKFSLVLFALLVLLIKALWHGLLFVIDIIDGGEPDEAVVTLEGNYNYMTGEIDSCHRADGFYDERFFKDYESPL